MQYLGKIITLILGVIYGTNILNIIINIIINYIYNKILKKHNLKKKYKINNYPLFFFISTFQILGHLIKAKGQVTHDDIQLVTNLMDKMELHHYARILAQNAFKEGKKHNFPLRQTLKKIREAYLSQFKFIEIFLEIQIQAVFINGILHKNQQRILFILAEELGISYHQFKNLLYMMGSSEYFNYNDNYYNKHYKYTAEKLTLEDAYRILGVKTSDGKIKIKRAYRKLMSIHHPDKIIAKGLSIEKIEVAKQKSQEIQLAYNLIKKNFN